MVLLKLPLIGIVAILLSVLISSSSESCGFTSIFNFGDSLSDTGNLLISMGSKHTPVKYPPYGETYFHRPTGRASDGRLVIDFIAQAMGIPLLPPYLAKSSRSNFPKGVNFAVAGATALDNDFFREKGFLVRWTNYSLGSQIEWFKQFLPSLCSAASNCNDIISRSLFVMGEIGGNDYNYPLLSKERSIDEVQTFVPTVVQAIGSAIDVVIELGAKTVLVPGNLPIGCNAAYLTTYQSPREEDYDPQSGCLKRLNEFSELHNQQLQDELKRARERHPNATIIYADYYHADMRFFSSPYQFGFSKGSLVTCCGIGGTYNYNKSTECGIGAAKACDEPSNYTNWDGIHMTEAAYSIIAKGLLQGPYTTPSLANLCPNIPQSIDQLQKEWPNYQQPFEKSS